MDFVVEERQAWMRTTTHTVILDRDPEFDRFARDPSGRVTRLLRIWRRGAAAERRDYLGAVCLGPGGYQPREVMRLFRRLGRCVGAREGLKELLRKRRQASVDPRRRGPR